VTRLRAGWPRLNSRKGQWKISICTIMTGTVLGPTHPSLQRVSGALSPVVKLSGNKSDHSSPSSTKVKNAWSYTCTLQYIIAWRLIKAYIFSPWNLRVVKHRDDFASTFTAPSNTTQDEISWTQNLTPNCSGTTYEGTDTTWGKVMD